MRLLLTVNSTWNIFNFRLPLVKAFLTDGHQVTILAPRDKAWDALHDLGCKMIDLKVNRKGLNPFNDAAMISQMYRVFAAERPDCILGFTIKNNIYGALTARLLNIPFIPNVTGLGTAFLSSNWLKLISLGLYKAAFHQTSIVFFQNKEDKELFIVKKILARHQTRVLPGSGIDLDEFNFRDPPPKDEPLTFLMISRILRDKGVIEYVEAAASFLGPENTRFQLLGAIDHDNRSAIAVETVREWEKKGIIEYLGTRSDVRLAIEQANCIVLPSYREGAPRTLIEAASLGRPLIATNVPGCRSVVDDGYNGYLCASRDSMALKESLERFSNLSYQAKSAMGANSREKMETQFAVAKVIGHYRQAISDVTNRAC